RWEYRVHEQILPSLRARGVEVVGTDVTVTHTGYRDERTRRRKVERNLRLLRLDHADRPDDPFVLFNLGWTLQDLGRHEESVPYLRGSLERSQPTDSIVRKAYTLLAAAHVAAGRLGDGLAACRAGLIRCPDDAELRFVLGQLLAARGDLDEAVACFGELLRAGPREYFGSIDARITGYGVHYELARLHRRRGDLSATEAHLRAAVEARPGFLDGWLELADIYLDAGRWDDLAAVLRVLEPHPETALVARLLRARGHMSRQEFAAARAVLEPLTRAYPEDVRPVLLFAYTLLQEGSDPVAAEAALRELNARAPEMYEPWRNLVVFLRHGGRGAEALAVARAARRHHPEDAELQVLEALALEDTGAVTECRACLEDLLARHRDGPPADAKTAQLLQMAHNALAPGDNSSPAG
ncbi:MAG: tetratricopeptide repeat protein, partial [Gemmataceae bacterium]|nr:tetratricopeptide repeat protein [Gemmataceae bacterium]